MVIVLVLLLAGSLYLWLRRRRKLAVYRIEPYLKIDKPVPLCGAPDVVWINKAGVLFVGDYKSRASGQVQKSDIIQLSVYKVLLEHTQQKPVADKGYVHLQNNRRVCVTLLEEAEVIELFYHYQQIVSGKQKAQCTAQNGYCRHCGYAEIC